MQMNTARLLRWQAAMPLYDEVDCGQFIPVAASTAEQPAARRKVVCEGCRQQTPLIDFTARSGDSREVKRTLALSVPWRPHLKSAVEFIIS
jgi:hypothetical protein